MGDDLDTRTVRRAAGLCALIWSLAWAVSILRDVLLQLSPPGMPMVVGVSYAAGALACWGLFLFLRRLQPLSVSRRVAALIAVAAPLVAFHAWAQSWVVVLVFKPRSYRLVLLEGVDPRPILSPTQNMLLGQAATFVLLYGICIAVLALYVSAAALQRRERSLAAAQAAAQAAQLEALRYQINPHFLFNAFNAVTSLIRSGRNADAEAVVARLSEFFRDSLQASPDHVRPLADEVDAVGAYLQIEKVRFAERLNLDIDVPAEVHGAMVPQFLLQPLVENAIKHGVARSRRPVSIRLSAVADGDALRLVVRDDADGAGETDPGASVGLRNIGERLRTLYGAAASLRTTALSPGFEAEIRLPLAAPPPPRIA